VFDGLQQTAGRRSILRDREAFPVFVSAVQGAEPVVRRYVDRVNEDVDQRTADRLQEAIRKVFGTVLKELDDLDNPMRTSLGHEPGDGAVLEAISASEERGTSPEEHLPSLDELAPTEPKPGPADTETTARPDRGRSSRLPSIAPDPEPGERRSRFDPDDGIVYYHEGHPDYLLVKDDESGLLDYLATLVAKEYVVYNNPKAAPEDLSEELVRMLVRVRRHLPRRR
jgi:hypothetical protein